MITPGDLFEYTFDNDGYDPGTAIAGGLPPTKQAKGRAGRADARRSNLSGRVVPIVKQESA